MPGNYGYKDLKTEASRAFILSYWAGLFDGEGHVALERRTNRGQGRSYTLQVGLGITHPGITACLQEAWGGSVKKHHQSANYVVWYWRVSQDKAQAFLEAIRPYSLVKAAEIDIALEFLQTRKRNRGKVSDEELELREGLKQRLQSSRYVYAVKT